MVDGKAAVIKFPDGTDQHCALGNIVPDDVEELSASHADLGYLGVAAGEDICRYPRSEHGRLRFGFPYLYLYPVAAAADACPRDILHKEGKLFLAGPQVGEWEKGSLPDVKFVKGGEYDLVADG